MEILPFLLAPFLASLILTGIHAYLGVHVVERGVIFVDLALAQIAALGATTAILIGMDPHGGGAYWLSLGFTFVGAGIFALARTRRGHVPQEAFIGIAYAVAFAGVLLVFCYLVVPSVGAMLFADHIGKRLAIGWTMGTLVSALGVYFSVALDLPTGATIVCTFGAVLIAMFFVHLILHRRNAHSVQEIVSVERNRERVLE